MLGKNLPKYIYLRVSLLHRAFNFHRVAIRLRQCKSIECCLLFPRFHRAGFSDTRKQINFAVRTSTQLPTPPSNTLRKTREAQFENYAAQPSTCASRANKALSISDIGTSPEALFRRIELTRSCCCPVRQGRSVPNFIMLRLATPLTRLNYRCALVAVKAKKHVDHPHIGNAEFVVYRIKLTIKVHLRPTAWACGPFRSLNEIGYSSDFMSLSNFGSRPFERWQVCCFVI